MCDLTTNYCPYVRIPDLAPQDPPDAHDAIPWAMDTDRNGKPDQFFAPTSEGLLVVSINENHRAKHLPLIKQVELRDKDGNDGLKINIAPLVAQNGMAAFAEGPMRIPLDHRLSATITLHKGEKRLDTATIQLEDKKGALGGVAVFDEPKTRNGDVMLPAQAGGITNYLFSGEVRSKKPAAPELPAAKDQNKEDPSFPKPREAKPPNGVINI